jgi:hypothetical protein
MSATLTELLDLSATPLGDRDPLMAYVVLCCSCSCSCARK